MAMVPRIVWITALCAASAVAEDTLSSLVVTGDRVCLRAKADGESEVVWQVSSGFILQGTGKGTNWVEVVAPSDAPVWVSSSLLSNGVVRVDRAQVRAGPGFSYPVVGSAAMGERLDTRAEAAGWTKVRPPPSCRLWVSSQYVKQASPPAPPRLVRAAEEPLRPAPPVQPTPDVDRNPVVSLPSVSVAGVPEAAVPTTKPLPAVTVSAVASQSVVATVSEPVAPASLSRYELEPGADQGRQALYRGSMDKCNWLLRKPAEYRLLVKHPRRGIVTLCYVSGDPVPLAALDGKRVAVSGREYRLKGIDRPVVVYETVVEDARNLTVEGVEPIVR